MTDKHDENPVVHLVTEMVEAAAATQAAGLALLQAEMQALTHVLPGVLPGTSHELTEAEKARAEAQTEADFDNMPV